MNTRYKVGHEDNWDRARAVRFPRALAKGTRNEQDDFRFVIANCRFEALVASEPTQNRERIERANRQSAIGNRKSAIVRRFAMSVDKDLVSVQQARDLIEAAHKAQAEVARFDQAKIDRICEAMAKNRDARGRAPGGHGGRRDRYGVPADKRKKTLRRRRCLELLSRFTHVGVVFRTKDVVEIASPPRGVVAGIIPSTNPTSTAIFKVLIAIKSRNAIVLLAPSLRRTLY